MDQNKFMCEDFLEFTEEENADIDAFDLAMADLAPNVPWAEVEKQLGLNP